MALSNVLKAKAVAGLTVPGMYGDGGGLYLQVAPGGSRSWIYRYKADKRQRHLGLGSYPATSLAIARDKAQAARALRAQGLDPLEERRQGQRVAVIHSDAAIEPDVKTFAYCVTEWMKVLGPELRNDKHRAQWTTTLTCYAGPIIGSLPVQNVTRQHVLAILSPIWSLKPEQAFKLRGRIERVLAFAITKEWRPEPNPADWRKLKDALPKRSKSRSTVRHHGAMPYSDVPAFVAELKKVGNNLPALAFELLILSAVRTRELLLADPAEFDLPARLWSIPGKRMKIPTEHPHRVPLSRRAVEIVELALQHRRGDEPLLFPGRAIGKPFSDMLFLMMLRRMGRTGFTGHGFRSCFKTWASEKTTHPDFVSEMALAHNVGSAVERAYLRTDLLERRRTLMDEWGVFVSGQ